MPVQLGGAFQTAAPPSPPTGDERRHVELLAELAALRDTLIALAQQPAPQVTVAPTDMSEVLYALEGLGISPAAPVVDSRGIGEAVADALSARQVEVPDRTDEVLEELKRIGRKFGVALANSAPVVSNDISSNPTRVLGQVEVSNFPPPSLLTKTDDDETQAALEAIRLLTVTLRDNQLRRTDPLPAGNNMIGRVIDATEARTLLLLALAARTTNGTSAAFATGDVTRAAIDVNVTAVAGVGPNLRLFLDRQGADGLWYAIWSPAALTAVGTLSTSVGQGMAIGQSLAANCRFRWEITGTNPSFTFSASIVGK